MTVEDGAVAKQSNMDTIAALAGLTFNMVHS